ncbi:MAG: hypothetical protein JW820_16230 [Spirochaetales bacterium]|nr:hypothetical protein [Spirochaetales bacterium]
MRQARTHAHLRRLLTLASAAMLACLAGVALSLITADPDLTGRRIWRGYYTLLLEPAGDNAEVARQLARLPGIHAVVSRHTAEVSFNTFGGFRSATISSIRSRLDADDPRLDPFLSRVDSLFRVQSMGTEWELMYLRSDLGRLPAAARLSSLLPGRRWKVADIHFPAIGLRVGLFLAFCAVLWVGGGARRPGGVLWAGLLPWLAAVAVGGWTTLLLFFLAAPLGAELLEAFRGYLARRLSGFPGALRFTGRRPGPRQAWKVLSAALGAAAAAILARGGTPALPVALPLISSVVLLPLAYAAEIQGSLRRFHRIFEPVPILDRLGRGRPWFSSTRFRELAVVALVIVASIAARSDGRAWGLPHYAPGPIGGVREPLSWVGLERLAAASSRASLPNLADYLSHKAFQEALSFGRPYGLPRAGERVRISRYVAARGGPQILRTERVVKRFQESWVQETLAAAKEGSVERLLVDQGFAALVVAGGEGARAGSRARGAPATASLAGLAVGLFLATYLLGRDLRLTGAALCATTSLTLRRHQHPS